MESRGAGEAAYRLAIRTRMDRRRAEALALELRRHLKQRGFHGASVTITPASVPSDVGGGAAEGRHEPSTPSDP